MDFRAGVLGFVAVTRKLKWLAILGLLGRIPALDPRLHCLTLLWFLILLDPIFWQSLRQSAGALCAMIAFRGKLPSKDGYVCRNDYILPFAGRWVAVNGGADRKHSHSWSLPSQRYAYDFVVMDDEPKTGEGDRKALSGYFCHGMDVLAPADGRVVEARDGRRDSRTNGARAYCDGADIRGNFVVIDHGSGEFSLTAHLLPGSLSVKVGDEVRQGQPIARCGNSGNTSQPHIHFQLQSGRSFYSSAGLPVAFCGIEARGKPGYEKFDPRPRPEELPTVDGRTYIARGFEVWNGGSVSGGNCEEGGGDWAAGSAALPQPARSRYTRSIWKHR